MCHARPMPRATAATLERSAGPSSPWGVSTAIKITSASWASCLRPLELVKDSLFARTSRDTRFSRPGS
jgi:hypothetical protein